MCISMYTSLLDTPQGPTHSHEILGLDEIGLKQACLLSKKYMTISMPSRTRSLNFISRLTFNDALSVVQEASILYKSCQETDQLIAETRQLLRTIRTLRRESILKTEALLQSCRTDPWFLKTFENRPFCSKSASEAFCSSAVRYSLNIWGPL
jgi:hypothetical protein